MVQAKRSCWAPQSSCGLEWSSWGNPLPQPGCPTQPENTHTTCCWLLSLEQNIPKAQQRHLTLHSRQLSPPGWCQISPSCLARASCIQDQCFRSMRQGIKIKSGIEMGLCPRLAWLAAGEAVSGHLALCLCLPTHQQTDCSSFSWLPKESKLGVRLPALKQDWDFHSHRKTAMGVWQTV